MPEGNGNLQMTGLHPFEAVASAKIVATVKSSARLSMRKNAVEFLWYPGGTRA